MALKPTMNIATAIHFFYLVALTTINTSFCNGSTHMGCIESEREALLRFKKDLIDPSNRLVSWTVDGDCCTWAGVVCDNFTGLVHELNLRNPSQAMSSLGGKVNPSLLDLKHLIYLDLSYNNFEGVQIPSFLGSMGKLRKLNLSRAGWIGVIPHQLGNLSNLEYLDLSQNYRLYIDNLRWFSGLSLLKYLDLSVVNLVKTSTDWLPMIDTLPSLVVLKLSNCQLHHLPMVSIANLSSSLVTLDLSRNQFYKSSIPNWVFSLSHLVFLDLTDNSFQGPLPDGLQNLTSLTHLDLSSNALEGRIPRSLGRLCNLRWISLKFLKLNQTVSEILDIFSGCVSDTLEFSNLFETQLFGQLTNQLGQFKSLGTLFLGNNSISGPIPHSLGELSSLRWLDLSSNKLNGPIPFSLGELSFLSALGLSSNELNGSIPPSLGKLSSLRILNLSNNKLAGTLSEIHFVNLTSLIRFNVFGNSLMLKASPNWIPPFQLEELYLTYCHLGPQFPSWILSQKNLVFLDISYSGILDTIPNSLWKSSSRFKNLNFSHNQIYGKIPNLKEAISIDSLDLSSNNLSGSLPLISLNVKTLDLSNNSLSGDICHFLCYGMNESKKLQILNLEDNFLSGELPDCWMNWQKLLVLNLSNNNFSGNVPASMGTLSFLWSLHLRNNSFSGTIPMPLKNCTGLIVLDISQNDFVGNVPSWLGERFSSLMILILRSNKFQGFLPMELCHLASLQILDLAYNNLAGAIPSCISNLSAMVTTKDFVGNNIKYSTNYSEIIENDSLMMKGKMVEYSTILNLVRSIDLSKNNFLGEIPTGVTNLVALQSLNLSHNLLTGRIPESIGAMRLLESIDLSSNQLYDEIPENISNLTFLNHLNLSNNRLTGKIPSSTQLQSLDASCFMGNELCGCPLPNNCTVNVPTPENENGGGKKIEVNWFYVSMALGYVVAFYSVIYRFKIC